MYQYLVCLKEELHLHVVLLAAYLLVKFPRLRRIVRSRATYKEVYNRNDIFLVQYFLSLKKK